MPNPLFQYQNRRKIALSQQIPSLLQQSTLSLFVARVRADYPHYALAADNLAILAYSFYRASDFHLFT